MTTTIIEIPGLGQADAIITAMHFAQRKGFPLPQHLITSIPGTDAEARAVLATIEAGLKHSGVPYQREDTAIMYRLAIDCGNGVTWRFMHCRCQMGEPS